jgi:hypothetical protein
MCCRCKRKDRAGGMNVSPFGTLSDLALAPRDVPFPGVERTWLGSARTSGIGPGTDVSLTTSDILAAYRSRGCFGWRCRIVE